MKSTLVRIVKGLVIGLAVTGKIPRSRAAIAGVFVWVIGALPALLGALRS